MWVPILLLLALTIYRMKQMGLDTYTILAYISQYFNFLIGGDVTETFSARVGRHVEFKDQPIVFWDTLRYVLDIIFTPFETEHCARSAERRKQTL